MGYTKPEAIDRLIRNTLNPHRYAHTQHVLGMALELGRRFGEDETKIRTAALFHDFRKDCTAPGNDLAHAGDAADAMAGEFGITDEDVLNAVRYHTTGRAGMSRLELIIFLADTLEPTRTYAGVDRLRNLVYEDLYAGALEVLKELNAYIAKEGKDPAPDSLEAIAWLEKLTKDRREALKVSEKIMRGQDGAEGAAGDIARSLALARRVADVIDDKRGRDIVILDISRQSSFADFFVNATATNTRMLATIQNEIEDALAGDGTEIRGKEGRPETGWILVDCGDVVVNLFLEEQRGKYNIEKIWSDAEIIDYEG